MAEHGGVTTVLRQGHRVQGLGQRANLVYLDENGVGGLALNSPLQEFDVGHKEIITNQLNVAPEFLGQPLPILPITLSAAIFNTDDRIFPAKLHVKVDQL